MSRLALYLLGPPRVGLDDELIQIPRRKAMPLLAEWALAYSTALNPLTYHGGGSQ